MIANFEQHFKEIQNLIALFLMIIGKEQRVEVEELL